jgi:hypothetical protein
MPAAEPGASAACCETGAAGAISSAMATVGASNIAALRAIAVIFILVVLSNGFTRSSAMPAPKPPEDVRNRSFWL